MKGIPLHLLPNIKSKEANFNVHWINNKDFHFTYAAELFSNEIYERIRKLQLDKLAAQKKNSYDANSTSTDENQADALNGKRKLVA